MTAVSPRAPCAYGQGARGGYIYICVDTSHHSTRRTLLIAACVAALLLTPLNLVAAAPGQSIIPLLQDQLGLTETQVRGGLGALLVFVRERLTKADFDVLAETIPNADRIMQDLSLIHI